MAKVRLKNRIIALLLALVFAVSFLGIPVAGASSMTYNPIMLDVPRISQRPNTGDCAIASIASVEAYMYNLPAGDYTSEAYRAVYSANGESISANWSALGYSKFTEFDMDRLYAQLSAGYPVIVHRTSAHYSVVYAYVGSPSALSLSGFLIKDVDDSYTDVTALKTLDKWKGNYELDQIIVRRDGLSITGKDITITCNHPEDQHVKGNPFSVYGKITSKNNLTSVTLQILNSSDAVAQNSTFSAKPDSKTFSIHSADSVMNFSKLTSGTYKYKITAKDSAGRSASYVYIFKVAESFSAFTFAETSQVSYYALLTESADLMGSNSVTGQYFCTMPKLAVVKASETDGKFIKVSYDGKVGWIPSADCVLNIGDINLDGKLAASDALLILTWVSMKTTNISTLQKTRADMNLDGKINTADALIILQTITK